MLQSDDELKEIAKSFKSDVRKIMGKILRPMGFNVKVFHVRDAGGGILFYRETKSGVKQQLVFKVIEAFDSSTDVFLEIILPFYGPYLVLCENLHHLPRGGSMVHYEKGHLRDIPADGEERRTLIVGIAEEIRKYGVQWLERMANLEAVADALLQQYKEGVQREPGGRRYRFATTVIHLVYCYAKLRRFREAYDLIEEFAGRKDITGYLDSDIEKLKRYLAEQEASHKSN